MAEEAKIVKQLALRWRDDPGLSGSIAGYSWKGENVKKGDCHKDGNAKILSLILLALKMERWEHE